MTKKRRKKHCSPLEKGEIFLVLSSRLKKKDAPSIFYKSITEQKSFGNRP